MALGAIGFVLLGMLMVGAFGPPPMSSRYSPAVTFYIGCVWILFSALFAVLNGRRLFETGEVLRIGRNGIYWKRWSHETIPWPEISEVITWSSSGQKFIVLHLKNPAQFPGSGVLGMLAAPNRALAGGHVQIFLTATDRSFGEAMAAIARFRPGDPGMLASPTSPEKSP
jgi:hypothetical protein